MKKGVDYIGVGVGAVIINKNKQIFLAKRGANAQNEIGKWECPGGSVRFGETVNHALLREVKEEHGFEIEIVELLGVCDEILLPEKQHWVSPSFLCKLKSGTPKILEPEKCEAIGWFTLEKAENLPLSLATKINLSDLMKRYPTSLPQLYYLTKPNLL